MENTMRRFAWLTGLLFVAAPLPAADKGTVVDVDGLRSEAPKAWKEEAPANKMRYAQFKIPGTGGDAELVIFKGLGGGARANVDRWKKQFVPPEGKKIDDVCTVTDIKFGTSAAVSVDISGTYVFKNPPFDPNAKEERRPDYRMLAIYIDGKNDVWQIKLTGPAKTVEAQKKAFDEWIKAFK
jgi:hypothetical protein